MTSTDLNPSALCIPMQLDAFVLNEAVCNSGKAFIAPLVQPDYSSLQAGPALKHDVMPHLDMSLSYPASINPRLADLDTGKPRQDRLGIYLHWVLPRAFRSGSVATESALQQRQYSDQKEAKGIPKEGSGPTRLAAEGPQVRSPRMNSKSDT